MASATVIAIVLLTCVLLFAGMMMLLAYQRQRVDWKRAPGLAEGIFYENLAGDSFEPELIVPAVRAAIDSLLRYSDFDPGLIRGLAKSLYIAVQRVESWHTIDGTKVGGMASGRTIYIGPSLGALLHECAHVLELAESNFPDYQHASWGRRGIWAADNEYRVKLAELQRTKREVQS